MFGTTRWHCRGAACGPVLIGLMIAAAGEWSQTSAAIVVESVSVDGREMAVPRRGDAAAQPIRISANAREVVFLCRDTSLPTSPDLVGSMAASADGADHLTAFPPSPPHPMRLRYLLDGYDQDWQDEPATARASLVFLTDNKDMTAAESRRMTGTSAGWRGTIEGSRFVPHSCRAVAPAAANGMSFSFLTDGDEVVGCVGIDDIVVRIDRDSEAPVSIPFMPLPVDLGSLRPESPLPGWWRPGSQPAMSRLEILTVPEPHAILVINDNDPTRFGNWGMITHGAVPVRPGDRVTLSWTAAYSFGVGGRVTARYPGLRPGRYTFRTGRFLPCGKPAGDETSLVVVVVTPYHERWELWAVGGAALTVLGGYAGRAAAARRLRLRLDSLERAHALERERSRIARDLHDEVGAGLTQIAMQVEKIRDRIDGAVPAETVGLADAVWRNAADLVRSVDAIVWAVSPEQDTLDRFVAYLVQSTEEFLDAAGLSMRFDVPQNLPAVPLDGTSRHRLFLAVREALHNAVKHSGGTRVTLAVRLDRGSLEITVRDDGRGFDPGRPMVGVGHDGLANMRRRMKEAGGTCTIESAPGRETEVRLVRPLPIDTHAEEPHHA